TGLDVQADGHRARERDEVEGRRIRQRYPGPADVQVEPPDGVGAGQGRQKGREGDVLAAPRLGDALQGGPEPGLELERQSDGVGQAERLAGHAVPGKGLRGSDSGRRGWRGTFFRLTWLAPLLRGFGRLRGYFEGCLC